MLTDLSILQCPLTSQGLRYANADEISIANHHMHQTTIAFYSGLVNNNADYFFPIYKEIFCLHSFYAIPLKKDLQQSAGMEFDKKRIFNYFNNIQYHDFEGQQIYDDANDFVDFRPFLLPYTQHGFYNCRQYLAKEGKYYVDLACGPVAFKEYIRLAEGFEFRICVDQSLNALLQAKANLAKHGQKGIFICGDLTAIPLQNNIADAVLCQHALFHVQKDLQLKAMQEMVRVAIPGKRVAIVYDWFYHSLFMNLALGPFQLYRIARHYAGKLYARMFNKDKLYFFAHSRKWFEENNPGKSIAFYVWRSFNIHFSKIFLHPSFGGKRLLNYIWKKELENPEKMGTIGEYPIIVIEK